MVTSSCDVGELHTMVGYVDIASVQPPQEDTVTLYVSYCAKDSCTISTCYRTYKS